MPMSTTIEGLTTRLSSNGPRQTMDRLEAAVTAKGLTVFARIDHAAGAAAAGLALLPTELLIFGNARGGTPLMQEMQTIGIDLPLKALVWQDAAGSTWLARRHGLSAESQSITNSMAALLDAVSRSATTCP